MTIRASIPPDLVEEILGNLHGDIPTLKICSTVAPTFHLSSRKLIFSSFTLDTPQSVINLDALLNALPDVAALIRVLNLRIFFPKDDLGMVLLSISHRVRHLRHLSLGCSKGLSWGRFSKSNAQALEILVSSENLRSLAISHVYGIPLPFFHTARGIWKLSLELVYIENDKTAKGAVHFTRLKTLSLGASVLFQEAAPLIVPELRQLSVLGPHPSSLKTAIQFIHSTSSVIEEFSWSDFHFDNIPLANDFFRIPLGVRRLRFEISKFQAVMAFAWSSIISVLNDSPAAQTVETLTIVIRHSGVIEGCTGYRFHSAWLAGFDVLADKVRFPNLTRVEIIVQPMTYDAIIIQDIMYAFLEAGLCKLHEAGTPTVNLCIDSQWHVRGRESMAWRKAFKCPAERDSS